MGKFLTGCATTLVFLTACMPEADSDIGGIDSRNDFSDRLRYFNNIPTLELCKMAVVVEEAAGAAPFRTYLSQGKVEYDDYARSTANGPIDLDADKTTNAYIAMKELSSRFNSLEKLSCNAIKAERIKASNEEYEIRMARYKAGKARCSNPELALNSSNEQSLNCAEFDHPPVENFIYLSSVGCGSYSIDIGEICTGTYGTKSFTDAMLDANAKFERSKATAAKWSTVGGAAIISCTSNTFFNTSYTECR